MCLSTLQICCARHYQFEECKLGQEVAINGSNCINNDHQSEYYTTCCESCKIGLIVGASSEKCNLLPFEFGTPWDESFETCCNEQNKGGTFILKPGEDSKYYLYYI